MNKRKLSSRFELEIDDKVYVTKYDIFDTMSRIAIIMDSMSLESWSTDLRKISKTNVEDCLK